MNNLFAYLLELNIALTLFYLAYVLLFRRDGNFKLRRIFLFFAMVASAILPLLSFNISGPETSNVLPVISLEEIILSGNGNSAATAAHLRISDFLLPGYMALSCLLLCRLIIISLRVALTYKRSKSIIFHGVCVKLSKRLHASSFFSAIFIDPEQIDEKSGDHILAHEICHAKLLHSVDRLMAEILLSLSWLNPVVWMLRKSVIVNHEYQADNNVIAKGTDQVSYQLTILNQYIGSASLTNQFSSQIKNRIIMLNKKNKIGGYWKAIMLLPLTLMLSLLISCGNESGTDETSNAIGTAEEELFYIVEEMPKWHDGSDMVDSMRYYIAQHLDYPDEAIANNVQGRIFVHFIVNKEGKVIIPDPSMLPPELNDKGEENEVVVVAYRTLGKDDPLPNEEYIQLLKDEGVRVLSDVPNLIPGKQGGKPVSVVFTFPMTFKLQ